MNLLCNESLPNNNQLVGSADIKFAQRVARNYSKLFYHYTPEMDSLLTSAMPSLVAAVLPINKILREAAKMLDLNLFECTLLHWLLKSVSELICSCVRSSTPWDASCQKLIQDLRTFDQFTYQQQAYSGLFACVLLSGFYAKAFVNTPVYMDKLLANNFQAILPNFYQAYSSWTKPVSLKTLTFPKVNQIFTDYFSPSNLAEKAPTSEFNYNSLVDRLLELSKPYNVKEEAEEEIISVSDVIPESENNKSKQPEPRKGRKPNNKLLEVPKEKRPRKRRSGGDSRSVSRQQSSSNQHRQKPGKKKKLTPMPTPPIEVSKVSQSEECISPKIQGQNPYSRITLVESQRRSLRRTKLSPVRPEEEQGVGVPIPLSQEDNLINMAMFQSGQSFGGMLQTSAFRGQRRDMPFRFMDESVNPYFPNNNTSLGMTRGLRRVTRQNPAPAIPPPQIKRTSSHQSN